MTLARARRTLPVMPHAHLGNPKLGTIVAAPILEAVRAWRMTEGLNLVLLGDTGCGKTTAAVALARGLLDLARESEVVRAVSGIRFRSALELHNTRLDHGREGFRAERIRSDPPMVAKAKTTSLLILDEVGFEPEARRDELPVVLDIMQQRYNAGLVTIVTSGLSEQGLVRRYGEATKRRMTERARVVSVFGGRQ